MRRRLAVWMAVALAGSAAASALTAASAAFQVVVGIGQPIAAIKREELANIFLRKATRWKDGSPILPVDQSMTSPVRKSFANDVLRMPTVMVQQYWNHRTFSGLVQPPAVRLSDEAVLEFVARNPGAIGYVSGETPLGPDVKAVRILEE